MEHTHAPLVQRWSRHQGFVLLVLAVLVVDQLTKYLVTTSLVPGESIPSRGIFHITYTVNTGSAFGLFPNQTLFLIVASAIGITVLLLFYRTHPVPGPWLKLSLGLQLGGAFGNLTDRALLGHVVDFIELGWWPVFNVADASIVSGLFLLAFFVLKGDRRQRRRLITTLPGREDPYAPDEWFYE